MCQRFHISLLVEGKQEEGTSYDKASVKATMNNGEIVEETPLIRGEITELNKDRETVELLVEGEIEEGTEYDKAKVTLHECTKIHRNEEEAKVEDLEEGMTVEIYYRGGVDMSYPVLMGADKIIILE